MSKGSPETKVNERPRKSERYSMPKIIINEEQIVQGEPYFALYVDCPKGVGSPIVADLKMGLIGPVKVEVLRPRKLTGFELPALEMAQKAVERAKEQNVMRILLVDPHGYMPLAKLNRYAL